MKKTRRWLLPFILMMILLPTALALLFSGYGLYRQQRTIVAVAGRYARGLAKTIVHGQTARGQSPLQRHQNMAYFLKLLTVGPPVPGWIATIGPGGIKLQGSPGSHITREISTVAREAISNREIRSFTLKDGDQTAEVVICPYPDGLRALIVVISHYLVPGPMRQIATIQPVVSIIVSLIALCGIFLLWKWCVVPLRNLAGMIEHLHWGYDILPEKAHEPLPELREMHSALCELSVSAADREILKKNYVRDIVRTQEEERTRLAREIHDSSIQTVASLIQRIQLALRALSKDPLNRERVTKHLTVALDAAGMAVQEMRDVCNRLAPPWISLGASKAIEELSNRLRRLYNILIIENITGDDSSLSEKTVLSLARIIQEAVSNAVRHGKASEIKIDLTCHSNQFSLTVRDNGTGFHSLPDPELLRVRGHRGIAGMSERATLIGASFRIENLPEGGTLITVEGMSHD